MAFLDELLKEQRPEPEVPSQAASDSEIEKLASALEEMSEEKPDTMLEQLAKLAVVADMLEKECHGKDSIA